MTATIPSLTRRALFGAMAVIPPALTLPGIIQPRNAMAATTPGTAGPAAAIRRRVGEIEIFALADGFGPIPTRAMIGLQDAQARDSAALAHKQHDATDITICINAYLIRTRDRLIAVDAGAPTSMARTLGAWTSSLAATGIDPAEIDSLFLTHAHIDHVGGMTGTDGIRTLPSAQLVASEIEWAFTHDDEVLAAVPDDIRGMFQFARGQLAPYAEGRRMLPMQRETEIAPGVTAVPLPGHTPGHMGLRVESSGEALLIWGDIVHAPVYQFSHPEWSVVFDADMNLAVATRQRLLDMSAADDLMVAGMHLDFPAFGHVERHANAYRYLAAPPDLRG